MSQHSYESQTALAFFKGDLGCIDLANPDDSDLASVVVSNTNAEEDGDHCGAVISRGEPVVRDHICLVLENAQVEQPDEDDFVPRGGRYTSDDVSGLVVDNPYADIEDDGSTDSMSDPTIVQGLEGYVSLQQV